MTDDGRQNVTDIGQQTKHEGGHANPGVARRPTSVIRHPSSDILIATACGAFAAFMVGMAYAAVPLYSWFCQTTGFGGIPQVAAVAPAQMSDRKMTVRFDANVGPGLPWRFEPQRTSNVGRRGGGVAPLFQGTHLSGGENAR